MQYPPDSGLDAAGRMGESDAFGVDEAPERRPGVPMETEPQPDEGAHWETPPQQESTTTHLHRRGLDQLTPVYGTAQPPVGISGLLRRAAYRIPEHRARHWMLLLAADRVDVVEHRLGEVLGSPLDRAGMKRVARRVQQNPAGLLLAAAAAGYLLRRTFR